MIKNRTDFLGNPSREGFNKELNGIERLFRDLGRPVVISAGISLSNSPHIGHMREFYVADSISNYLTENGIDNKVAAVADDSDPLKKLYSDMPENYAEFVGMPLCDVPDYSDEYASRAEKHISEFQVTLARLGLDMTIIRSSELYDSDKMHNIKKLALDSSTEIGAILSSITGSKDEAAKGIINARCPSCGKVSTNYTTGSTPAEAELICTVCRDSFSIDLYASDNKFRWRVDWPARWAALDVDIEPVAEDHATRGGSYQTASAVAREIFNTKPATPIHYRWARLKTGEAIHGSSTSITAYDVSRQVAPLALKAFFNATPLSSELVVDSKNIIYETLICIPEIRKILPTRAVLKELYYIAAQTEAKPSEVAGHVYSIYDEALLDMLDQNVWEVTSLSNNETMPNDDAQQNALTILKRIVEIDWKKDFSFDDFIRNNIEASLSTKKVFQSLYVLILGQQHGPRLDKLLAFIGKEHIQMRIQSIAS